MNFYNNEVSIITTSTVSEDLRKSYLNGEYNKVLVTVETYLANHNVIDEAMQFLLLKYKILALRSLGEIEDAYKTVGKILRLNFSTLNTNDRLYYNLFKNYYALLVPNTIVIKNEVLNAISEAKEMGDFLGKGLAYRDYINILRQEARFDEMVNVSKFILKLQLINNKVSEFEILKTKFCLLEAFVYKKDPKKCFQLIRELVKDLNRGESQFIKEKLRLKLLYMHYNLENYINKNESLFYKNLIKIEYLLKQLKMDSLLMMYYQLLEYNVSHFSDAYKLKLERKIQTFQTDLNEKIEFVYAQTKIVNIAGSNTSTLPNALHIIEFEEKMIRLFNQQQNETGSLSMYIFEIINPQINDENNRAFLNILEKLKKRCKEQHIYHTKYDENTIFIVLKKDIENVVLDVSDTFAYGLFEDEAVNIDFKWSYVNTHLHNRKTYIEVKNLAFAFLYQTSLNTIHPSFLLTSENNS